MPVMPTMPVMALFMRPGVCHRTECRTECRTASSIDDNASAPRLSFLSIASHIHCSMYFTACVRAVSAIPTPYTGLCESESPSRALYANDGEKQSETLFGVIVNYWSINSQRLPLLQIVSIQSLLMSKSKPYIYSTAPDVSHNPTKDDSRRFSRLKPSSLLFVENIEKYFSDKKLYDLCKGMSKPNQRKSENEFSWNLFCFCCGSESKRNWKD